MRVCVCAVQVSYSELHTQVCKLANVLKHSGVKKVCVSVCVCVCLCVCVSVCVCVSLSHSLSLSVSVSL